MASPTFFHTRESSGIGGDKMMNSSKCFGVRLEGGIVALTSRNGKMYFFGSNLPTDATLRSVQYHTLYIRPPARKGGIVFVAANAGEKGTLVSFVIPILWDLTQKHVVDLEKVWIPPADKMVHFTPHGMDITIGERRITTSKPSEFSSKGDEGGRLYLPDANLACRYLMDEASAEELFAAVEAHKEELTLPKKLEMANAHIADLKRELADMTMRRNSAEKRVSELEGELKDVTMRRDYFEQQLDQLCPLNSEPAIKTPAPEPDVILSLDEEISLRLDEQDDHRVIPGSNADDSFPLADEREELPLSGETSTSASEESGEIRLDDEELKFLDEQIDEAARARGEVDQDIVILGGDADQITIEVVESGGNEVDEKE